MGLMSWAENEVELACKREAPDRKPGEWDYGCACYESALKAFQSLVEDGHSGMSIGFTKAILNHLIDHKPLTPIEDTDDIWSFRGKDKEKGSTMYQCKRMSSLFKTIYADGTVKYSDFDRCVCVSIDNPNYPFHIGLVKKIIYEMYPITMPYIPEDKPYKVYIEDFLTDSQNGDFDTVGIFYVITPNEERVEINRFFKESNDGFVEITQSEYLERKEVAEVRKEKSNDQG